MSSKQDKAQIILACLAVFIVGSLSEGSFGKSRNEVSCGPLKLYDPSLKKCVIPAGSPTECNLTKSPDGGSNFQDVCVHGASCNLNSYPKPTGVRIEYSYKWVCQCLPDFTQTPEGTCKEKQNFAERCDKKEICKNEFICSDGTCKCREYRFWDPYLEKCVCEAGSLGCYDCGSNADRSKDVVGECKCNEGFELSPDGICHPGYQSPCANGPRFVPCLKGLICIDGKCNCELGELQYYNKTCLSFDQGPCNGTSCTPNAECFKNECRCRKGFLPVNGLCEASFGMKCDETLENAQRCDQVGGLKCIGGICKCGMFQEFNKKEGKCEGLPGAVCDLDREEVCAKGNCCLIRRGKGNGLRGICRRSKDLTEKEHFGCIYSNNNGNM